LFDALEKSPMRKRIIVTQYLNDEELRALYSSCRAFVYPSIYEGFGLPPLEAMACGAPVIASRIPALEETTGGAALLFNASSDQELARSISKVMEHKNVSEKLVTAGLRQAAKFSWEKTARTTLEVYKEALKRF